MVDEGHVGVRVERVDIAAGRALGRVAHIGVLGALEQLHRRRIAAILDIQPGNGGDLDHGYCQDDADDDRNPAEDALLHVDLFSSASIRAWACGERTRTRCAWLAGQIVGEAAGAGQQTIVLDALDVLGLAEHRHYATLTSARMKRADYSGEAATHKATRRGLARRLSAVIAGEWDMGADSPGEARQI